MSKWPLETLQGCMTFSEWEAYLNTLTLADVGSICQDAMEHKLGIPESLNFYVAAYKKMRDMAHLSIAFTDDERMALTKASDQLVLYVEAQFSNSPDALQRFGEARDCNDEFYRMFGTKQVREWLYDRGFCDKYGVELKEFPEDVSSISDTCAV